jgi:porin
MKASTLTSFAIFSSLVGAQVFAGEVATPVEKTPVEDPFADRLFGDWGGVRTSMLDRGITIDLDAWYHLQGVMDGGRAAGDDVGNLFSGRLGILLDTDKAGLWPGGFFKVRLDGRGGDDVNRKAGATSPVNNDALLPLVPGRFGEDAWALTEVTYTQFLSPHFGLTGGLLNTDGGDTNPIAGNLGSNSNFLNTGLGYSPVLGSTTPNVTLGGGAIMIPNEHLTGAFLVFGTNETAGNNPFDYYEGTTFSTEWTYKYALNELPGGVTVGATYGINQERFRITENPRVLLQDVATGGSATTDEDSWSIYWNGFQYLQGDESKGWGLFGRLGFSDGETNPIDWNAAAGIGGVGLLPSREQDRWGLGAYYQEFDNQGILSAVGIDNEVGGELFYNFQVTPATNVTLDLQVIDSALPRSETAVVGGLRVGVRF